MAVSAAVPEPSNAAPAPGRQAAGSAPPLYRRGRAAPPAPAGAGCRSRKTFLLNKYVRQAAAGLPRPQSVPAPPRSRRAAPAPQTRYRGTPGPWSTTPAISSSAGKQAFFPVPQQVEGQRQPAVHTAGAHQQHLRRKRQIDAEVVHLHPGPGQQHRPGEHQVEQPEPRQQPHKSPPPRPAIGRGHCQRPGAALVEQPDTPRALWGPAAPARKPQPPPPRREPARRCTAGR